jgi:hypothetical protein
MLYVEEIKRVREETEERADKELLRREREMERESRYEYKERQRRLRLYAEYHKTYKSLIVPYDVPQDPKGVLYRELKETYEKNVACIDDVWDIPTLTVEHMLASVGLLIAMAVGFSAVLVGGGNVLFGPSAKIYALLVILLIATIYTLVYPTIANRFIVKNKIRLAAECEVTCHILENRNPTLRYQQDA